MTLLVIVILTVLHSVKDDPPGGGDIPRADGLPRGLLHEARGEDHPEQALQVEKPLLTFFLY